MLDGLEEGERVVTRGAIMIDSALQIQAKSSMMQPTEGAGVAPKSMYQPNGAYHASARAAVDAYVQLVEALASDDAAAAGAAAGRLRQAAAAMDPEGLAPSGADQFREAAGRLRQAVPRESAAIEECREALPELTRALTAYLQGFGHNLAEPLVEAFCPMAFNNRGASWLQLGASIRNPYFGSKMLRCGEVRRKIAPDGRISR